MRETTAGPPPPPPQAHVDALVERTSYVRLPPGRRHVWVPLTDRGSTLAGISLYSPAHRRGQLGQSLATWCVRLAGGRALPLPRERWTPPLAGSLWCELREQWRSALGPVDAIAVYERPQASRTGLSLLLTSRGRALGFVKLREAGEALVTEQLVLSSLPDRPAAPVGVPRVLAAGGCGPWRWLATRPLPVRPGQGRWRADPPTLLRQMAPDLRALLPRPEATPPHWEPMHGDLTPWNVRTDRSGRLWVYDWEGAGWGPPGADDAYYRATSSVARDRPAGSTSGEVVDFWLATVVRRSATDVDARFNVRLGAVLESMRA